MAIPGQTVGQRCDPSPLIWRLVRFQQQHQARVIAQKGRQDLPHSRSRRVSAPIGDSERYQQAFIMKFVEIKSFSANVSATSTERRIPVSSKSKSAVFSFSTNAHL